MPKKDDRKGKKGSGKKADKGKADSAGKPKAAGKRHTKRHT